MNVRAASIAIVIAVLVAGCGGSDQPTSVTTTVTRTETVTKTVTAPASKLASCSTDHARYTLSAQPALPAPVARTRQELFDAATSCDFEQLGAIAARNTDGFAFTFGAETDPVAYWKSIDAKERTLDILARILTTPFVKTNQGGVAYAWPSVYHDTPTAAEYADLVASGAYTQAEVDAFQQPNGGIGYLGYRVSIAPDGTWQFFTVGD